MIKTTKPKKTSRFASARIALAIALTTLIACCLTVGYALYASYDDIRDRRLAMAHDRAIQSFQAAVDPTGYPTRDQLLDYGRHLVRIGQIQGGAFYDSVGELQGSFGKKPLLTWHRSKLNNIDRALVDDGQAMEVFIDPNTVEIDFSVAVRVDITDHWTAINDEVARDLTYGLAVSLAVTASLTILLTYLVLYPLHRVQRAIQRALDEPKDAIANSLNWRRNDEVGAFTRNLDQLFYVLSNTFREDLGNALAIQAHTPHGLVIYTPEGQIDDANPAALSFFDAQTPAEIEALDPAFLRIDGEVRTVYQVMETGQTCVEGEILNQGEWVPVLIAGDMIRRSDGSVRRYFLIFADISFAQLQINEALAARDGSIEAIKEQKKQTRELRGLLDACLAIIENGSPKTRSDRSHIYLPDRSINQWYREALDHGDMKEKAVRHPLLPPVDVDPDLAKRLFSHALSVVQTRSMTRFPFLLITAQERADRTPVFTITETESGGKDTTIARAVSNTNSALYLNAFKNLLHSAKGQMILPVGEDGTNILVFELKAATALDMSGKFDHLMDDKPPQKVA